MFSSETIPAIRLLQKFEGGLAILWRYFIDSSEAPDMRPETDVFLTIEQLAGRYGRKVSTVKTLVSRNPGALPPSVKLGSAKNAPVRFRLSDILKWEAKLAEEQTHRAKTVSVTSLRDLLGQVGQL